MRCEIEGLVEVDHRWLEDAAISQRKPTIHLGKVIDKKVGKSLMIGRTAGGELFETDDPARSIGKLVAGPSTIGSYIVGDFDVEKVGIGKAVGSLVADALNLASEKWDLGLLEMVAAPEH